MYNFHIKAKFGYLRFKLKPGLNSTMATKSRPKQQYLNGFYVDLSKRVQAWLGPIITPSVV